MFPETAMRMGRGDGCVSVKQERLSGTDGKERTGEREKCGKRYSCEDQNGERARERENLKGGWGSAVTAAKAQLILYRCA